MTNRFSLKLWLSTSLGHRIRFYALMLTTIVIVLLGGVSYAALRLTIYAHIEQKLNTEAQQLSRFFSLLLNSVSDDVDSLAKNSFIANSLVDSSGKEGYLLPFLRNHKNTFNLPIEIILVDFQGNPIAANDSEYLNQYELSPEIKLTLEQSQNRAAVITNAAGEAQLLLISPIIFPPTQHTEGAVIVKVSLHRIFNQSLEWLSPDFHAELSIDAIKLNCHHTNDISGAGFIQAAQTLTLKAPFPPLVFNLHIGQQKAQAFAYLHWFSIVFAIVTPLMWLLVFFITGKMTRKLVQPISKLTRTATRIAGIHNNSDAKHSDEITQLSESFDLMLRNLHDSYELLENKVIERTQKLRENEEYLRQLIQLSPIPIAINGYGGKLLYLNEQFIKVYGYSLEDLTTLNEWWLYATPNLQYRQKIMAQWKEALVKAQREHSDIPPIEYQITCKNGSQRSAEVCAALIGDKILMIFNDLTERKSMEDALRASEQRLHELVNIMPISVFVKDLQSRIILMNNACEAQWGTSFAQLQNTTGADFFAPEQLSNFIADDQRVFLSRCLQEREEQIWNASLQAHRIVHTYKKPVFDEDGKPLYLIGLSVDMSEYKRQEEKLRQAKIEAEKANQAKSEFLANMSHEIRTPMNAILGFSSILYEITKDPIQRHYLESINSSGKTLLQLINDILDLSKIEAGKFELKYTSVAIKSLFHEIGNVFTQKLTEKSVAFRLEIDDRMPDYVTLDEIRLRQVLLNLVGNAVKFTHHGFVGLSATIEEVANNRINLFIEVMDSGIGIAADQQQRIFSAFTQQENQSLVYGGTGLGLTICKRLLDLMRGEISVSSTLNSGSCFTVKLYDVLVAEDVSLSKASAVAVENAETEQHFQPATVLIVDDLPINRILIKSYLREYPELSFLEAANAEQAFEITTQQKPDLILMDRRMPGESGDEVCRRIRALSELSYIPIIMVTASVLAAHEQEQAICYDFLLSKPLTKEKLLAALEKFLIFAQPGREQIVTTQIDSTVAKKSAIDFSQQKQLLEILRRDYQLRISELKSLALFDADVFIELAQQLQNLAQTYHCQALQNWAELLQQQAEFFDLVGVPKTLARFDALLAQLALPSVSS